MKIKENQENQENIKQTCKKIIYIDAVLRIFITILFIYIILKYTSKKYIYLVLPIALSLLDFSDNILSILYSIQKGYINICRCLSEYQITDKLNDLFSYFLVYIFFSLDYIFLIFLIWRTIGVVLFSFTKNVNYLIIMFDFMKEYLLYKFIFGNNYFYIPIAILAKISFEYYFHLYENKLYPGYGKYTCNIYKIFNF
jgi:hypothetical protein